MRPFLPLLVVPVTFTLGCTVCSAEPIEVEVTMDLTDEEVRALPVLSSGATDVAGVEVPDSHGRFAWRASVDSVNVSSVDLDPMRIEVRVDGDAVPIEIIRVEGVRFLATDHEGRITGTLEDDAEVEVWWTVDAGQDPEAVVLPEGADYEVHLDVRWRVDGCAYRAAGEIEQDDGDQVRAAVMSTTFAKDGDASVQDEGTGHGFEVPLRIKNGVDQRVDGGIVLVTRVPGGPGAPGVVFFEQVSTKADGVPSSTVLAAQRLTVEDVAPRPFSPPAPDPALDILVLVLEHEALDGTQGAETSVFGYALTPTS